MGLQASEGTIAGVNGPGIPAALFNGDTSAVGVSLQGRRPQGQVYPVDVPACRAATTPAPCLVLFPSCGWDMEGTGSCRWVQKQDSAGGSWKEDISVKYTQRRPDTHSTCLRRRYIEKTTHISIS